ncbi:P-loop containing nucleoside triphosphate hydrolase protein [Mycena floridula]|nr:P-loop containing nucleoside triphosphate hydrolase protein [Mycena floridula]
MQIPSRLAPSVDFLRDLDENQRCMALRMCILCWKISVGKICPREYQISATIAIMQGRDSIIYVGTGYGKTLCMILPLLLKPDSISIVVSPLRRLQIMQLEEFTLWGLRAASINQDTPKDDDLYRDIAKGKYNLILVQAKQLNRFKGHLTRFARLLGLQSFVDRISRVHVDEAHFIYLLGLALYGQPAFRPLYGQLDRFRVRLRQNVPFQALSGTLPSHIKRIVISKLLMDESILLSIKLSSNRPNIVYALHPIVGSMTDYRNLAFLIPSDCTDLSQIERALFFVDDKKHSKGAIRFLESLLPPHLLTGDRPPLRHYDSIMSPEYLQETFDDFKDPEGSCRIVFSTESASANGGRC